MNASRVILLFYGLGLCRANIYIESASSDVSTSWHLHLSEKVTPSNQRWSTRHQQPLMSGNLQSCAHFQICAETKTLHHHVVFYSETPPPPPVLSCPSTVSPTHRLNSCLCQRFDRPGTTASLREGSAPAVSAGASCASSSILSGGWRARPVVELQRQEVLPFIPQFCCWSRRFTASQLRANWCVGSKVVVCFPREKHFIQNMTWSCTLSLHLDSNVADVAK